jgi:hypothetical protein
LRIQRLPVRKESHELVVCRGERIKAEASRETCLILLDAVTKEIALREQLRVLRALFQGLKGVLELIRRTLQALGVAG